MTKYDFDISKEIVIEDVNRLTNQIWKLIPMRENGEDWVHQLDTVLIELAGLNEIFIISTTYLILLSKLEGLKVSGTEFSIFRTTVFESISLLRGMLNE